jgi:HK97 family phage major capsid protein
MLTRKTLIDSLKANGLTGEVTLDSAKSHIARLDAEGVTFADEDGKPINVDAVWSAKSSIVVPADTSAKGTKAPHAAIADEATESVGPQRFSIGNANRKAYARKVAEGKAAFNDADQAEAFGAWARATLAGSGEYGQKKADLDIVRKAQVEFNNQLGGALVPIEFMPNLVWLTEQYGVARKLANVVPMSRDVMTVPRKTGIAAMTPAAEDSAITATDNTFGNVTLTSKKYAVLTRVSRELLADSAINVADEVARSIAEAQAIAEDQAYFLGDGTATYANQIGLAQALPSGNVSSGLAWGSITTATFLGVMASLQFVNESRLAFVCSRQFYYQVMLRLEKALNQYKTLAEGLPGANAMFLGYPVFFSQVLPITSGATRACYFGDFMGGSMIGDRRQLEIATSDQFYFNQDALAVRGTARFVVNIHLDGRNTPAAGPLGPIGAVLGA